MVKQREISTRDPHTFCAKHVLQYLIYILAIGVCVAGLFYILMHAHPSVATPVKNAPSSLLVRPDIRIHQTVSPFAV